MYTSSQELQGQFRANWRKRTPYAPLPANTTATNAANTAATTKLAFIAVKAKVTNDHEGQGKRKTHGEFFVLSFARRQEDLKNEPPVRERERERAVARC